MSLPMLPSFLSLDINVSPDPFVLVGKPNNAGTRIWFETSGLVPEEMDTEAEIVSALESFAASYEGVKLNAGEVHTSAARKYAKTHAKAGQEIPGTGGNLTVTHSLSIELTELVAGGPNEKPATFGYTLMVTATYVEGKGFRLSGKAIPQAESTTVILTGVSFRPATV